MLLVPYALTRPFLFGLDAERAHDLTMDSIARLQNTPAQCLWAGPRVDDPVTLAGLRFPNRLGLAAGLDKNGRCIDGLGAMGFGFIEVGTVTPKGQPGNPKPRMFRLPRRCADQPAGLQQRGLDSFVAHVRRAHSYRARGGIVGLNIGKNAPRRSRAQSTTTCCAWTACMRMPTTSRSTSQPQHQEPARAAGRRGAGRAAVGADRPARRTGRSSIGARVPLFLKIAPDLDDAQVSLIAATLKRLALDGVIATNTTISRDAVQGPAARRREPAGSAAARCSNPATASSATCACPGPRLSDHRRGRRDERRRRPCQGRGRRRPGADLHRADLPRPGAGDRSRARAGRR
jgi:dihydroorotate dehydrogenase